MGVVAMQDNSCGGAGPPKECTCGDAGRHTAVHVDLEHVGYDTGVDSSCQSGFPVMVVGTCKCGGRWDTFRLLPLTTMLDPKRVQVDWYEKEVMLANPPSDGVQTAQKSKLTEAGMRLLPALLQVTDASGKKVDPLTKGSILVKVRGPTDEWYDEVERLISMFERSKQIVNHSVKNDINYMIRIWGNAGLALNDSCLQDFANRLSLLKLRLVDTYELLKSSNLLPGQSLSLSNACQQLKLRVDASDFFGSDPMQTKGNVTKTEFGHQAIEWAVQFCTKGDLAAWTRMEQYCRVDVALALKLFYRVKKAEMMQKHNRCDLHQDELIMLFQTLKRKQPEPTEPTTRDKPADLTDE